MIDNQQDLKNEWQREVVVEKKPVMSIWNKIVKIFTSPYEVFENLMEHPKILLPIIVVCILAIFSTLASLPFSQKMTENLYSIYEQYNIPMNTEITNSMTGILSAVFTPISILIMWSLMSVFFWLAARLFKIKVSITQVFSVYAHALIIQYSVMIITMLLNSYVFGTGIDAFSLIILYPNASMTSVLYYILQAFTLPTLWALIITGLGISYLGQKKPLNGILSVFIIFILSTLMLSYTAVLPFMLVDKLTM